MFALVQNVAAAKQNRKVCYDRLSCDKSFKPGQKVPVMLPTNEIKPLAKWHGPFIEIKTTGAMT